MLRKIKNIFILIISTVPSFLAGTVYYTPPDDFDPKVEASGCFIEYQDKFLMLHRQDHKPQGNTWGVPGGKLDQFETPHDAVIRETSEETQFDISSDDITYFGKVYLRNDKQDVIFHIFVCKAQENPGEVKIAFKEHKGFTWVTPQDALKMNLMENEEELIELIYGKKK